jgi:type IV pilus assembly protein PilY1
VYAGDLLGNVWRFDLTSTNPNAWAAGSTPVFTVSPAQPITTKLLVAIVPQGAGNPRLMLDFGTGRKFEQTTTSSATYATGQQSLYGVWDWNMASWNALATPGNQLASLTAPQTVNVSTLATQSFSSPSTGVRDVTANSVCWAGTTTCTSGNTQFGWILALPGTNEQVVFNPTLDQNAFVVNTTIPANNSPTACTTATDTGFTVAVSAGTGGLVPGFFQNYQDTTIGALQTNGTGTPFGVTAAGQTFLLTQSLGNGCPTCGCPPGALYCSNQTLNTPPTGKRLTWIQRR